MEPAVSRLMRTPRSLDIEITARCNLRCRYCCFFNNPAIEYRDLPGFGTNSAGYLGTCRLNADDVMLTTAERQSAMATLLRLAEKYPDRISASAGPLAEGRTWRRMEEARVQNAPASENDGAVVCVLSPGDHRGFP